VLGPVVEMVPGLAGVGLAATSQVAARINRERMRAPSNFIEFVMRAHLNELDASEGQRLIDQCLTESDVDFLIALTDSVGA
jgi:hypothetical protein